MSKVIILRMCPGVGCPRMAVTGEKALFRDDYKGQVNVKSKLLKKLSNM